MIAGLTVLADQEGWVHMSGWGGAWMWFWGVAMMALFLVAIVWLARAVVGPSQPHSPADPNDRGRQILAERYARGDLSTEEYRERLGELR